MSKFFTEEDNAEFVAQQAILKAQEEKAEEERRQAQRKAEHQGRVKEANRLYDLFVPALSEKFPNLSIVHGESDAVLLVDGVKLPWFHEEATYERLASWKTRPRVTGSRLKVDFDWDHKQGWPKKKDGTYSWDKVADFVMSNVERIQREAKKEANERRNAAAAAKVHAATGLSTFSYGVSVKPSADPKTPLRLTVELKDRLVDEEKAMRVFAFLKSENLI